MNKIVANTFAAVLDFFHLLFVGGLGYIIYYAFQKHHDVYAFFLALTSNKELAEDFSNPINVLAVSFFVFCVYAFFMGFVSTIISIHEQLVEINEKT